MARLAVAALLLMAVAAAAAADACPPGCASCRPYTDEEKQKIMAAKEAKRTEWRAKVAAKIGKDVNGDNKIDDKDAPTRPDGKQRQGRPDKVWMKCETCKPGGAYQATPVEGRCLCAPGHGIALPTRGADGKPVKPTTAPECTKCAGNTVAGPDAPHVDWAQLGFVKREGRRHGAPGAPAPTTPAGGGRHLLGRGGKKAGLFCVPCPEGQEPNGDNTKCIPKSGP